MCDPVEPVPVDRLGTVVVGVDVVGAGVGTGLRRTGTVGRATTGLVAGALVVVLAGAVAVVVVFFAGTVFLTTWALTFGFAFPGVCGGVLAGAAFALTVGL